MTQLFRRSRNHIRVEKEVGQITMTIKKYKQKQHDGPLSLFGNKNIPASGSQQSLNLATTNPQNILLYY